MHPKLECKSPIPSLEALNPSELKYSISVSTNTLIATTKGANYLFGVLVWNEYNNKDNIKRACIHMLMSTLQY